MWEEQNTARDSHILTECVGCGPVAVDCFAVRWEQGDMLVLTMDELNLLPLNAWPTFLRSTRSRLFERPRRGRTMPPSPSPPSSLERG